MFQTERTCTRCEPSSCNKGSRKIAVKIDPISMGALTLGPAKTPTSVQKPLTHGLGDIEGQPLRGAPCLHIPATEVPLLRYVLIWPKDLCQKEWQKKSASAMQKEGIAFSLFFSHSLLKTNSEGCSWQVRHQEYPGSGEEDILHNQLELQRSTRCLFLCPQQPTSLSSELFWGTHPEAEAHGNSFNGWVCFCIHLWNMDLDVRVEPPVVNTASCHKSPAQQANLLSSHCGIFRCPTLFNLHQNAPGLFRFGDLCLCSDISFHFRQRITACSTCSFLQTPG